MRTVSIILLTATLAVPLNSGARAGAADNVRTAKRVFLEKIGAGHYERLDEIYGPGFVAHGASRDYTLDESNESDKTWRLALPDLKVTVERTVADKDLVAVHWRGTGTNTVAAGGMPGNGAKIGLEGMTFFRFSSGRILEEWSIIDVAALRMQLR